MVRAADSILKKMMRISETAPRPRGNHDALDRNNRRATKSGWQKGDNKFRAKGNSLKKESPPFANEDTAKAKRPRIGLAMSAGGARGLAHVGVIQVLEENGIKIDWSIRGSLLEQGTRREKPGKNRPVPPRTLWPLGTNGLGLAFSTRIGSRQQGRKESAKGNR